MKTTSLFFCLMTLAAIAAIHGVSAADDVEEPLTALYSSKPSRKICPPVQIACPKTYDPICIETEEGRSTVCNSCVLANRVAKCNSHIRVIALVACKDICE